MAATLEQLGRIDALVNNAGIAPRVRADLTEATEESFDELIRVNLQGPYFLTQAVVRHWLAEKPKPRLPGGFKVIFITSVSADTASVNRGDYCISKAGLSMAAQLWAARLAADGDSSHRIAPGHHGHRHDRRVKGKYDKLIAKGLCRSIAGAPRRTSASRCARSSPGVSRSPPGRSSRSTAACASAALAMPRHIAADSLFP